MRGGRAQVASNCSEATEAAELYLSAGGDAAGAVITGFFAAAGAYPGVLLGPATALLADPGAARARAFDGRVCQPGGGPRRARGWLPGARAPDAARVGVAHAGGCLLLCGRYAPTFSPRRWLAPGIAAAGAAGKGQRASVLESVSRLGAAALQSGSVARALLHAVGPVAGGLLTQHDLDGVRTRDCEAACKSADTPLDGPPSGTRPDTILEARAPWATSPPTGLTGHWQAQRQRQLALIATDAAGRVAGVVFDCAEEGFPIEELALLAPFLASPPVRGEPRIAPGQPLPSPAPLCIELGPRGPVAITANLQENRLRLRTGLD